MRILSLCGSLRASSSNRAILEACAKLTPPDVEWSDCELIERLPHFNPDDDRPETLDPSVAAFRTSVRACDGLVISCPEYAHSLPGSFKNALDWLVSEPGFPGKPVTILHVDRGTRYAFETLIEVLRTMSAEVVPAAVASLSLGTNRIDAAQILSRADLRKEIERAITVFVAHLRNKASKGKSKPASP